MKLEGVFVANATFFDDNGWISVESLRRHMTWLADAGVSGFVPCGTTGEGSTLTLGEREKILTVAKQIATERGLKVIAGCGGNHTLAVVDLVRQAKAVGCDAALVVTPYYNKPTLRGLLAHFLTIADKSEIPIVLYNVPSRTLPLPVDTAVRLLQHPNIIGIKEASGSYANWLQLAHDVDWRSKSLLAGDDDALAVIEALGGSGMISASANILPKIFVAIHAFAAEKRFQDAFRLQVRIYPLLKALFMETNPSPVKYVLHKALGFEPHLRLPLVPVTDETAATLETALKRVSQDLELM